jgi:hypothetical protein
MVFRSLVTIIIKVIEWLITATEQFFLVKSKKMVIHDVLVDIENMIEHQG